VAFTGALCEVLVTGVIENVWHCDIASLYPSTILAFDCVPKGDTIGIFKRIVADLRSYRLDAKKAAKLAADPLERSRLTALQSAFKILINSLYGYLAFPFGHFADFEAAERVNCYRPRNSCHHERLAHVSGRSNHRARHGRDLF
jgi:DNA polymerase I